MAHQARRRQKKPPQPDVPRAPARGIGADSPTPDEGAVAPCQGARPNGKLSMREWLEWSRQNVMG
ncbi:MAG: hypothetical protein ACK4KT_02495 [Thermaurantimonas sp.]